MKHFEAAYVKCVKVFFFLYVFVNLDFRPLILCCIMLNLVYSSAKSYKNIIVRLTYYEICVVNRC